MGMTIEKVKEASLSGSRQITGVFVVTQCEYKPFKNKPGTFLQCILSDKTGSVKSVVWDHAEPLKAWLTNKKVVSITGESTRYNDQPQVAITKIEEQKTYDRSDFIPSLPKERIAELQDQLEDFRKKIKDDTCRKVWSYILTELRGSFFECPGSSGNVHHGYQGGLLEHVCGMLSIAEDLVKIHPELDSDILYTGCLVHDIGKIHAYEWRTSVEMTDAGRLMHHSVLGYEELAKMEWRYDDTEPLNSIVMMKLKHICISHHDKEEGAVRRPMFPEAVAVAMVDNADAAVNGVLGFVSQPENIEPDSGWTRYSHLAGRKYFLSKASKVEPEPVVPIPETLTIEPEWPF